MVRREWWDVTPIGYSHRAYVLSRIANAEFHPWYCSIGAAESSVRPHGDGDLLEILIAILLAVCASLVIGMLAFGPRILEWIEGTPS
jgi:hypothetical protein